MTECARCGVNGNIIRLYDAIYEGDSASLCERCALIENIPLIRKPNEGQIKESEKDYGVYDRLNRMRGVVPEKKQETTILRDRLKEIELKPENQAPKSEMNLIDHFYWHIMNARRHQGFTQKQLAGHINELETDIQMLERGRFPLNYKRIIYKIESFLKINLRRQDLRELIAKKETKPVLIDEYGRKLEHIPEPEPIIIESKEGKGEGEIQCKIENKIDQKAPMAGVKTTLGCARGVNEKGEVNLDEVDKENVTIAQMREIHKRKIEATRQEMIEEQKRIEERQRLIEARKEELRLMKEKQSRQIDDILGGSELLEKKEEVLEEKQIEEDRDSE
ncbi:MAG: helix-turn-helix domain-containing protein [Candidatus Nanoarchaeia archaeon]